MNKKDLKLVLSLGYLPAVNGTGWPSFWQPYSEGAVKNFEDRSHGMVRVEVKCGTCEAHLGHVFPDGPEPTGLRYCMNSVAMIFEPKSE